MIVETELPNFDLRLQESSSRLPAREDPMSKLAFESALPVPTKVLAFEGECSSSSKEHLEADENKELSQADRQETKGEILKGNKTL